MTGSTTQCLNKADFNVPELQCCNVTCNYVSLVGVGRRLHSQQAYWLAALTLGFVYDLVGYIPLCNDDF